MAGKSTFMRQTALIVLMAQAGCFVPAASASIGIVDGIYTRIGASDDLAAGRSTFMVEMCEVADILRGATDKSLLILDEIGRGTSTYDGMSIARAVIEYVADTKKLGAKTLFATHYHELTELENSLGCVKNYNTAVKKRGDEITFLRKIVRGGADDSYGIEVSKLAGIPPWVVNRAHEVLKDLEAAQPVREARRRTIPANDASNQITFMPASEVEEELKRADLNTLTPIEALTLLYKLKGLAR
jgi:DNA mismatch repair protein MutS